MENTYKDILKSSGLVAYVQVFQMAFGLIRNKVVAMLLGAGGFGIWGMFNTFMEMSTAFSTLGVDRSGVREIARHSEEKQVLAQCIATFRQLILYMSIAVCAIVMLLSRQISTFLFGTDRYTSGVVALSLVIVFKGIASGNISTLNGLRHLKYLAYSQIWAAVAGSLLSVLFVVWLGEAGIVWALLSIGGSLAVATYGYVRRLHLESVKLTWQVFVKRARPLLWLGIGFSASSLVSTVMTLFSRSFLSSHFDLSAVGIYQASWTISNLYIGIILSAMGVDFMPRLTKVVDKKQEAITLINQQLETGLLLSSIGVVGILAFSDIILYLLYAKEFMVGSTIIRWQVLGVALRIFAFPFSFGIAAKGKAVLYFITQLVFWTLDYLLLMFFGNLLGFNGLGVNYVCAYIVFVAMVYGICCRLYSFSLSPAVKRMMLAMASFIGVAWCLSAVLPGGWRYAAGAVELGVLVTGIMWYLKKRMDINVVELIKSKLKK